MILSTIYKTYSKKQLEIKSLFVFVGCLLSFTSFGQQHKTNNLNHSQDSSYQFLFRKQADSTILSSVGYTNGDALKAIPISSVANALTGRFAGLHVQQSTGLPGKDYGAFSLRGLSPLVLVDGIPRNANSVLPDHVESVLVLKDALATAALGVRGANGAILITTKKGSKDAEGFQVQASFQTGVTNPLKVRNVLSADQTALLYNEALKNDGYAPYFNDETIRKFADQSDPIGFPNIDWNKLLLKNQAGYERYSVNIEGGTPNLQYFVATDYLDQKGLFQQSDLNRYSTNTDFKRFGFRGNVSFDIDKHLSLALNLYGSSQTRNTPGGSIGVNFAPNTNELSLTSGSVDYIFNSILTTPSFAYPVKNPDESLGGNTLFTNNLWGQLVHSGYSQFNNNDAFADFTIKRDMSDIWKGWWINTTASYTMEISHNILRNKNFQTFEMNINPVASDTTYNRFGSDSGLEQSNSSIVVLRNGSFFLNASTGYKANFDKHGVDVSLSYQYNSARFASQIPFIIQNGILSASYHWDQRYLVDIVGSYSGNNWYEKGSQYELYPAIGLGWNVHHEPFFKSGIINKLKVRGSYGLVGSIDANYYSYLYTYRNYGGAYIFGTGVGSVQGMQENQLPYTRTTEKALKMNLGADLHLFSNRLAINLDYYDNTLYDNLTVRGTNTGLLGAPYPAENLNEYQYQGFEMNTGWSDQKNKWSYYIGANFAIQYHKLIENDEPTQAYPWLERRGNPVHQVYGYIADGFIQSAGEGPVFAGYQSKPGDLKYKDLNQDGFIDFQDIAPIGNHKPRIYFGLNTSFAYQGFDLQVQLQGVKNREVMLTGLGEWEFQSQTIGSAFEQHLNRWTPETAATATYPRLSSRPNINNHVGSSFWLRNADFIRLKTLELGYTITGRTIKSIGLNQIRIFGSGYNLLTISSLKHIDPENLSYNYPITSMYNVGFSVKF